MKNSTPIDIPVLEARLGITFFNKDHLLQALTHRSYLNEQNKFKFSNERLEFLGDSILSLVISSEIFHRFPSYPEGKLTATRSILVQAKTLARLAEKIGLGNFLLMSKGEEQSGGRKNVSLLADSFEAVLGAIYLDQGIEQVTKFLKSHVISNLDEIIKFSDVTDYKSQLQEKIQESKRLSPTYTIRDTQGPDHAKQFYVDVLIEKQVLASGVGKSKQDAEQDAARAALENLASK